MTFSLTVALRVLGVWRGYSKIMIRVVSVITVEDGDDDHNKIKRGKGQECTFILCRRGFLLEIIPLFPGKKTSKV